MERTGQTSYSTFILAAKKSGFIGVESFVPSETEKMCPTRTKEIRTDWNIAKFIENENYLIPTIVPQDNIHVRGTSHYSRTKRWW